MQLSVASDAVLHRLFLSPIRDVKFIWVKHDDKIKKSFKMVI